MKRVVTVLTAFLLIACTSWAQQKIDESRAAPADGVVEVHNIAGSVDVVGWSKAEVKVTGTLGRGTERLAIESSGNRTVIRVILPHHARNVDGSDLTVQVPRSARVEVETVSANVSAHDLTGKLDLQSVSGKISVKGNPSQMECSSVSGTIQIEATPDKTSLETVSGKIKVARADGELTANSVSGSVIIQAGSIDGGKLSTTSGTIRCEAAPTGNGTLKLKSLSGSVTLVVPKDMAADFELSTFSGTIHNEIGPKAERTSRYAPGRRAEFSTGSGGPQIEMNSFSGTIELLTK
ncbi:MAG: DUF4097 family beta strand repeat-containing protein [Acidobacteria bacterium]|jgi:DUF4097 and DUF4098 domain-containing protein YvlB|nr:DUF4097 family beta strand repeat-containing protein [Acidobacteriota bacterium]